MARLPPNFVETARTRFAKSRKDLHNWRSTARDDYAFVSGRQWSEEDEATLREQKRPTVVFNYSEKMIDAVVGAEITNRQEVTYRPREMSDDATAELLTQAAHWTRDQCDAEDQDTDAFRDMLICGLGWTETRMNYERDAEGLPEVERVDPLEMLYDTAAMKRGLSDRRWNARQWWVDESEAKREWPNMLGTGSFDSYGSTSGTTIQRGNRYNDEVDETDDTDLHKDQVQILHYQCVEREPFYRVADGDQMQEVSAADFSKIRDALDRLGIQYVKQDKLVYYRAFFAGDTLLEGDKSPCQEGFTFQAITGKRDRNKNNWYGLTRVMKDPQRWANKWLSQIMHIINTNAKGGLIAESGAFADPRRAQEDWAKPDSITMLTEGGISKIQPKPPSPYPNGLDRLMEFALSSLPQVTGINLEALGLAAREQANVLEQSRKQAAYGLLAPLFDSLRAYRKSQGRVLLYFIRNFISDGRLIRVTGPNGDPRILPLIRVPDMATYDIIVDQAPNSPDVKAKTWETLVQILPAMMKAGLPIPPDLIDFTPLPTALAKKWKDYIAQQSGGPSPEQLQQMQQEMQKLQQENQKLQQAVRDKSGELQLKQAEATAELQLKKAEAEAEIELKRMEILADIQLERLKLMGETELNHTRLAAESDIKERALSGDLAIKSKQADAQAGAESGAEPAMATALANLAAAVSAPKTATMPDGRSITVNSTAAQPAKPDPMMGKLIETLVASQKSIAEAVSDLADAVAQPKVAKMPDGRSITVSPSTNGSRKQ